MRIETNDDSQFLAAAEYLLKKSKEIKTEEKAGINVNIYVYINQADV
jgi:hypothetical protein